MNNECTNIINPCDMYSDLWESFFMFFKDYTNSIFYNAESEKCLYPVLKIETLFFYEENENVSLRKSMIGHLMRVDFKYIKFLLGAFCIRSNVNQPKIEVYFKWMESDISLSVSSFNKVIYKNRIRYLSLGLLRRRYLK